MYSRAWRVFQHYLVGPLISITSKILVGSQNEWNQGFSSDFLSLPQPQGSGNSGAHQFAFNNQQDFGSQPGFNTTPMYGGQQYNDDRQYSNQQAFEVNTLETR